MFWKLIQKQFKSVSVISRVIPKGGTSKRRGGEVSISFKNWSPQQFPITLFKLIPKTIQSVSVSVIKTEINSKIIYECV